MARPRRRQRTSAFGIQASSTSTSHDVLAGNFAYLAQRQQSRLSPRSMAPMIEMDVGYAKALAARFVGLRRCVPVEPLAAVCAFTTRCR
jgi:hypothetical protein